MQIESSLLFKATECYKDYSLNALLICNSWLFLQHDGGDINNGTCKTTSFILFRCVFRRDCRCQSGWNDAEAWNILWSFHLFESFLAYNSGTYRCLMRCFSSDSSMRESRGMYLCKNHGGCYNDRLWLMTIQTHFTDGSCDYDAVNETEIPKILYSPLSVASNTMHGRNALPCLLDPAWCLLVRQEWLLVDIMFSWVRPVLALVSDCIHCVFVETDTAEYMTFSVSFYWVHSEPGYFY